MRVYTFSTRNRGLGLLAGLLLLGAGTAFLVLGVALLAGLAVVGGVLGLGIMGYRMLRGQPAAPLPRSSATAGLDPALEVFADPRAIDASGDARTGDGPNEDPRRIGPT